MSRTDALEGKRFLVVEDNAFARDALCELLAAHGAQAEPAEDGAQAMRLFERSGEGTYDAALMDLDMPEMGGCAASRAIRRLNRRDAERIPIFALTAAPPRYAAWEAKESGMDACLQKPLSMRELAKVVACANGCSEIGGTA